MSKRSSQELGKQSYKKILGNEHAEAIRILNDAIEKDSKEKRLYTNRCYCQLALKDYERAKFDAMHLVNNFPEYPNGYFLFGELYLRLKKYKEAEAMFEKTSVFCDTQEVQDKLMLSKIFQIRAHGHSIDRSRRALTITNDVQQALKCIELDVIPKDDDKLGGFRINLTESEEKYLQRELDEWESKKSGWSVQVNHKKINKIRKEKKSICSDDGSTGSSGMFDPQTDPRNPKRIPKLWIGNAVGVTEAMLKKHFSKYGKISKITVISEKKCAFVLYEDYKSAGLALQNLQGLPHNNQNLLIKYPTGYL